ncbi:MAG: hypothetical protein AAGA32_12570, partial [Pseudomonadota bacterium]
CPRPPSLDPDPTATRGRRIHGPPTAHHIASKPLSHMPRSHMARMSRRDAPGSRWLAQLPHTMASCPTAPDGLLFVCPEEELAGSPIGWEEKRRGSRALLVVARDAEATTLRFGAEGGAAAVVYTRTGFPFFKDPEAEAAIVARLAAGRETCGLWRTTAGICWKATSIENHRTAPSHVPAAEGQVFVTMPHVWHMETNGTLAEADPIQRPTAWRQFDGVSGEDRAAISGRWQRHTTAGAEGLVIKPNAFVLRAEKGFLQPAMQVWARDGLRIVYGPDRDLPQNTERPRQRGFWCKLSLAEREFKLGFEGLHRFVDDRHPASWHAPRQH